MSASAGHDGLVGVVASGDRRAALEAIRDVLADEIAREADTGWCPACRRGSSTLPQLVSRLTDVLEQVEALVPAEVKGTPLDELRRRREARSEAASAG